MSIVDVATGVVASCLDRLGAQDMVDAVAIWVLINPLLDGREHVALDLAVLVAESWMMEGSQDIFADLAY